MDFRQLKTFVTVAECGGFTQAAEKLGISQPTASLHVRTLENELGRPLLLRTAKHTALTADGYKIFEQAKTILALHKRMTAGIGAKDENTIYIGASSIPSNYILPDALAAFRKLHPEAMFSVHQDDSENIATNLADGLVSIGFFGMPSKEPALKSTVLCKDKIVLVTPNTPEFATLANKGPVDLASFLKGQTLITRKAGSGTKAAVNAIFDSLNLSETDFDVIAQLNDQEAIRNLVKHGLGVSLLSEWATRDAVEKGDVLTFDIAGINTKRNLYIARNKNTKLNALEEEFFSFMRLRYVS